MAIYAKDHNAVPAWMKYHNEWEVAHDVNKLTKWELEVKMCCLRCEEKAVEGIMDVRGVFDVKAERSNNKVIVVLLPEAAERSEMLRSEVLKKAKKVNRKAKFIYTPPKTDKKEEKPKEPKETGKQETFVTTTRLGNPYVWGHYSVPHSADDYKFSQNYPARTNAYNPNYPYKETSDGPQTQFHAYHMY